MSDGTSCAPTPVKRFDWERRLRDSDLPPTARLVGMVMASYANRDGTNIHPGIERLRHDCGVANEVTIRRNIAHLVAGGWVTRVMKGSSKGRRALADVYVLTVPVEQEQCASELGTPCICQGSPCTGAHPPAHPTMEVIHHSAPLERARNAAALGPSDDDDIEALRDDLQTWARTEYDVDLDIGTSTGGSVRDGPVLALRRHRERGQANGSADADPDAVEVVRVAADTALAVPPERPAVSSLLRVLPGVGGPTNYRAS